MCAEYSEKNIEADGQYRILLWQEMFTYKTEVILDNHCMRCG